MTETSSERAIDVSKGGSAAAPEPEFNWDGHALSDRVIAALRTVHDPKIPLNIYDLGLIYRINIGDHGVDGIDTVIVNLVFGPPWDQSRMSDEAKLELGLL
jgi:metal-sulfur cluster biosynthetic enzyme